MATRISVATANVTADRIIGEGVRSSAFHNVAIVSETINRLRASAIVANKDKGDRLWKMMDNHFRFCDGKHYHEGSCDHGTSQGLNYLVVPIGGTMPNLSMCIECGEVI